MSEVKVPDGWVATKLGKYIALKNGFAFKSSDYIQSKPNSQPIIRISNLVNNIVSLDKAVHIIISPNYNDFVLEKGDLLIAMSGATTGKIGVYHNSIPAYQNQRVGNLKLINKPLSSEEFRNFLIQYLSPSILEIAYGGAQPNISKSKIEDIDFIIPPLAEQKEIAKLLEQHLAQVEQIKAHLAAIPKLITTFRQSVLADAVSGKLTTDWRGNKDTDNWKYVTIGEISDVKTGSTPSRKNLKYWEDVSIPWLTSSATGEDFCYQPKEYVSKVAVKECNLKLHPVGSLMLAMYGEGKTRGQVTELMFEATCNQACAIIIVNNDVNHRYVKIRLKEHYAEIRLKAAGGNQPNLNLSKVRDITINIPPLEEQNEIVSRVEELFTFADNIERQVQSATEYVNLLTQSILAKAFRGELTEDWRKQNPELISGENSAEALLARIQAQMKVEKAKS